MNESNNTGWFIGSGTLAPDGDFTSDLVHQMESRLGSDDLANKLYNHLLPPRRLFYVGDLKQLYMNVVQECVQAAGLNISFADALAGLLFPKGH
eukprot:2607011-Pleurochrysis_carterae.AAC.1